MEELEAKCPVCGAITMANGACCCHRVPETTYIRYIHAKKLTSAGVWVLEPDVEIEFSKSGKIVQAKLYNDTAADFESVDLSKISNFFRNQIQKFVYEELGEIAYDLKFGRNNEECA